MYPARYTTTPDRVHIPQAPLRSRASPPMITTSRYRPMVRRPNPQPKTEHRKLKTSETVLLNDLALTLCQRIDADAARLGVVVHDVPGAGRIIDCGVEARGGLEAGIALAEVCLAGLGHVAMVPGSRELWPGPCVTVRTDQPVRACMASQYAGWPVQVGKYFAMGSGPMRAARGREPLFEKIGHLEKPAHVVGVLEVGTLPTPEVLKYIAEECGVGAGTVTLLVAPTTSIAGTLQIAARSLETALHKMVELGYDIACVVSGFGSAPLPPVASDQVTAIGRTNDAILYGGEVTIWLRDDDAELARLGPKIPSESSPDYGQPFAAVFERYERDFYRIDPLLFSPAAVTLVNLNSGASHTHGRTRPDVLKRSFDG
jgi:methenyltetrahydromethanopterin cyclohydrolase